MLNLEWPLKSVLSTPTTNLCFTCFCLLFNNNNNDYDAHSTNVVLIWTTTLTTTSTLTYNSTLTSNSLTPTRFSLLIHQSTLKQNEPTNSLHFTPTRDSSWQVLGSNSCRLHKMSTKWAQNSLHDLSRLVCSLYYIFSSSIWLERRTIWVENNKRSRVPYFSGHWLSNLRHLHNILLSAHIDSHFLLENLPSKYMLLFLALSLSQTCRASLRERKNLERQKEVIEIQV